MGVIQTEDDRVCARKCMQTTNCTGITFAPDRNSCILKGGAHTPSSSYTSPGWCSAPLYCTANTDYNYAQDKEVIQTADDRVCARKCMQTADCTGISLAPDRNSCILRKGANTLTSSYTSPGWCSAALYCRPDTDYNAGHDVGVAPLALADDRICAARCMATDGCTGIAMLPDGTCALRGGPTSKSSTTASTGACSAPLHCFANTDYNPGSGIRCEANAAPNDHVCAMACMATDGCTGYAVDTLAGLCCLRSGAVSPVSLSRRPGVCGAPLVCTSNTDTIGSGGRVQLQGVGDDRLCAAECMSLDSCAAFTFDAAQRTCTLSVGALATTRAPGLCAAVLGCRPNSARTGTVLVSSPELRGNDPACSALCAAAIECTAYSVNSSLCVLFSGATANRAEPGTCSAATVCTGDADSRCALGCQEDPGCFWCSRADGNASDGSAGEWSRGLRYLCSSHGGNAGDLAVGMAVTLGGNDLQAPPGTLAIGSAQSSRVSWPHANDSADNAVVARSRRGNGTAFVLFGRTNTTAWASHVDVSCDAGCDTDSQLVFGQAAAFPVPSTRSGDVNGDGVADYVIGVVDFNGARLREVHVVFAAPDIPHGRVRQLTESVEPRGAEAVETLHEASVRVVGPVVRGHFALTSSPSVSVGQFALADVDAGLVVFVGGGSASVPSVAVVTSAQSAVRRLSPVLSATVVMVGQPRHPPPTQQSSECCSSAAHGMSSSSSSRRVATAHRGGLSVTAIALLVCCVVAAVLLVALVCALRRAKYVTSCAKCIKCSPAHKDLLVIRAHSKEATIGTLLEELRAVPEGPRIEPRHIALCATLGVGVRLVSEQRALVGKELVGFERSFRQYYQMHHEDYTASRIRQGKLPLVFVVTAAWEVRNPVLESWYEARRRHMTGVLRRTGEALEERVAFHGTRECNVGPICDKGLLRVGHPLNPSHSTDTGFFGDPRCGVYASRFVEYTLQYSNCRVASDGHQLPCPVNEGAAREDSAHE
eukprot:m51a1_g12904 hypothetical protein (992) ;mRNA; f:48-3166